MKGPWNSLTWPQDAVALCSGFSLCCGACTEQTPETASLLRLKPMCWATRADRLHRDQQTLLVLNPWQSSVACASAMTCLCLLLLDSCSMQCWLAACYSSSPAALGCCPLPYSWNKCKNLCVQLVTVVGFCGCLFPIAGFSCCWIDRKNLISSHCCLKKVHHTRKRN